MCCFHAYQKISPILLFLTMLRLVQQQGLLRAVQKRCCRSFHSCSPARVAVGEGTLASTLVPTAPINDKDARTGENNSYATHKHLHVARSLSRTCLLTPLTTHHHQLGQQH